MAKLTQDQVIWVIDQMELARRPVTQIARMAGVSPQWVRALWRRSDHGEFVPVLEKVGRKPVEIGEEDQLMVLEYNRQYRLDPIDLQVKIRHDHGITIPKNLIWRILKEGGVIKNTPAKQKQRKWVRWEREHSNSLWQTDFTQLEDKWLIAYLDDASRFITGWAVSDNATAELAWNTFEQAGDTYGYPRQLLSDNGTQFTKVQHEAEGYLDRQIRLLESQRGVKVQHILGRRNHPQTTGKIERWFGTLKSRLRAEWPEGGLQFPDGVPEFVEWYNTVKPHRSLDHEAAETPEDAFIRKMRPEDFEALRRGGGRS